ncbi:MAG: acyl-CoA carboxylase subunit beta [Opitutae bacterium]|nr:acyl-CoA carboxylase subunit beta [Opitutae bacterium]MCD8298224.1 acyl-CoA carboxylase subunit beta [Opitutae bacterium]
MKKELIENLKKLREKARAGGGEEKLAARRDKGLMTARDRIEGLVAAGSFMEFGMHVKHHCRDFGMDGKELACDGVVTGVGNVDGRPVAVFSQDFTVQGGTIGHAHAQKIAHLQEYALTNGIPLIGINDAGGARIQEGEMALKGFGDIFYRNVQSSGVVPQISIIAGPCAGGAAYSPALTDFIIMKQSNAQMFITGPEVIRAVTGESCTMDEIGSAAAHASISGNVHFVAEDDAHALQIARRLLSYLPSNNMQNPPHRPTAIVNVQDDPDMAKLVPDDAKVPLDMAKVIDRLFDENTFFEVMKDFAKNAIIGFARMQGIVCGIVANQPMQKAGVLDIDASDKCARFIRFCNAFNIPLVTLVDVPGFLPGKFQEKAGIIRHGAKMIHAYSASTVPKITLILRKAYGGAYIAMCSKSLGADVVYAWPTAEIAVMGPDGAANIVFKKDIVAHAEKARNEAIENGKSPDEADRVARNAADECKKAHADEYAAQFATPYRAAANGIIDDVIDPGKSRALISMALRNTMNKRGTRPPKKHGNMPL